MIPEYTGTLRWTKMNKLERKAYECWYNQRKRCFDKTNKRYASYGALGISQEYSSREFMAWWLYNFKFFKGKTPTVGRIDHSKNYCFDNIEMIDASENTKERNNRCGNPAKYKSKKVLVFNPETKEVVAEFSSARECAIFYKNSHVHEICRGLRSTGKKYRSFKYKEMLC